MIRHSQQRGQALALSLGFIAALALAFSFVLVAGQAAFDKLRLTNIADAAALSAATWEARSLNMEAALNRAMIANEAAIAQSISLRSWSGYLDRLLPNMNLVLRFVPYLGAATQGLERVWHGIDRVTQPSLRAAENVASAIDQEFSATAELLHLSAPFTARALATAAIDAGEIRARLTRGGEASLDADALSWARLSTRYTGAARARQADLISRSTDAFTRQRNNRFAILPAGPVVRLERRGGTDLLGFDTWRAADTQSLHLRRFVIFGGWRERVPLGWAAAQGGRDDPRAGWHGGSAVLNPAATRAAMAVLARNPGYRGIPGLRDVSTPQLRIDPEHRLALRLTSQGVPDVAQIADAAASVRYRRAQTRPDHATERGTLFEPYWEARLAPLRAVDRAAADALDNISAARRGLPL